MRDWKETGSVAQGCVIAFEGINQDEQDKLDVENFARGLKAPTQEDPGGKAFARTAGLRARAWSPMDAFRVGLGLALALLGHYGLEALGLSSGAVSGGTAAGFLLGVALPTIVALVQTEQAEPVERSTADAFRLTVSSAECVVEGQTTGRQAFDIAAIDRFEGVGRLTVYRRDGTAVALPCSLTHRMHGPLAARLNELLREARALRRG